MTKIKSVLLVAIMCISIVGCKQNTKKEETKEDAKTEVKASPDFSGDYVSEGYAEREKGYDWVAVSVTKANDNDFKIEIVSRADIKKPTCTFDALAQKKDDSTYVTSVQDKNILFTFDKDLVNISSEKPEDSDFLHFFCNGGATIAGAYSKIAEPLVENKK